ncbi:MAG: pirin family protein [Myxococcota bacterium]|nr:pirin family protein [Myxococcota bacterium]
MIRIRRSEERGHADHGWLQSAHTFSFAGYHDPAHMGFRSLRVINEDRVRGGAGFPPHGHRDMEILSYVLEGGLAHEDSTGHREVLRPGEVQRMSAGRGVMHSEFNASETDDVRFLQIWILPAARGLEPSYEQRAFPEAERRGRLRLLAAPGGEAGAVDIHQDVKLHGALLDPGQEVVHELAPDRHAWIQIARGAVTLNGEPLSQGDGAAVSDEKILRIAATDLAEVLVFDLA